MTGSLYDASIFVESLFASRSGAYRFLRRFACPLVQLAQLSCNARDKSSASVAYNLSGRAPFRAFVQRFILLSKGARHRRKYRFLAHCIFQFHCCSFVLSVLFSNLYIRILLFLFRFLFFFTKKIAIVILAVITRKTMIIVAVSTCSCASHIDLSWVAPAGAAARLNQGSGLNYRNTKISLNLLRSGLFRRIGQ